MFRGQSVMAVVNLYCGDTTSNDQRLAQLDALGNTLELLRSTLSVDRTVIYADTAALAEEARLYGLNQPIYQLPAGQADNNSARAVDAARRHRGHDVVAVLQPAIPLASAQELDTALGLMDDWMARSLASVTLPASSPWWMLSIDSGLSLATLTQDMPGEPRIRDVPDRYSLDDRLYLAESEWLLSSGHLIGEDTVGYVIPHGQPAQILVDLAEQD